MKSKSGVLIALSLMAASAAYSQGEADDMYFNSKDRAKLLASKPVSFASISKADDALLSSPTTSVNPTDGYSGRGENPEYAAKGQNSQQGDPQYFTPNYQPTGVNQNLNSSYSGYNNNSSYYGNYGNYYGMNSMYGNPYSSFYSPYSMGMGYGMGSPYGMGMGYGMSYGMGYGMGMGYPFGMGYGMGYPYGSMMSLSYGMGYPYMGFGSMYGMYGYGSGLYGYGYPSTININNDGNSGYAYGKRSARSNGLNNPVSYTRPSGIVDAQGRSRGGVSNGRSSGESQYYQRGWRSTTPSGTGSSRSSFWSNSGNSNGGNSSWGNRSNSNSFGGFNNSRSSSGGGFSGGGFSGGGGHSGGGGRGRH